MTQKDQVQELRELIAATKTHFAYIQELGVENLEISTALAEGLRQQSTANLTTGATPSLLRTRDLLNMKLLYERLPQSFLRMFCLETLGR